LTESCACGTIMDADEISTGGAGPPLQGVQIQLINWDEGNYTVNDQPCPRGEIVIGGGNVASEYFRQPEKTKEDFFRDATGCRWFRTGDIGQINPDGRRKIFKIRTVRKSDVFLPGHRTFHTFKNRKKKKCVFNFFFQFSGTLKIVDRKKDLVKLHHGEYVSLGKVESLLKTHPLIDNICAYGDSMESFVICLVMPDHNKLTEMAEKLNVPTESFEEMCKDTTLNAEVVKELQSHGKKVKLERFEIPGAVSLCPELWTPESGLVTAAFKLKRKPIQDYYQKELKQMYEKR
jgi:long-chain acyl-CoA synthetase